MPSAWLEPRPSKDGKRWRVRYRLGGRESKRHYGGSFRTQREARLRRDWIAGELARMQVPDLSSLAEPEPAPLLRDVARRWQESRVDVRESTAIQHRTALGRALPVFGERRVDAIKPSDVAALVAKLGEEGKARESTRKTLTALGMVLDYAEAPLCGRNAKGEAVNAARDRKTVKLPLEEPEEPETPSADHIEAVGWLLTIPYMIALLVLDVTAVRVGELEAARVGDLDEQRKAWLVRAAVSKTRRPRWVRLPDDLYQAVLDRLPPREDRDPDARLFPGVTADRLRMAIGRACRDAGVPHFAPHSLRSRRISLLHHQGESWAEIGDKVGQKSKIVTADVYTHALVDYREVDRAALLTRVRAVLPAVSPYEEENAAFAGTF
jgi:integrase